MWAVPMNLQMELHGVDVMFINLYPYPIPLVRFGGLKSIQQFIFQGIIRFPTIFIHPLYKMVWIMV